MQVTTRMIKSMVTVNSIGRVEISMLVLTRMIKDMGMEKCFGLMAQYTKEIGSKACNMDLEKSL
jgi:hypothetical protein